MPDYTILLIDYDPRSIERLRAALVKAGLRVEVAKDGLTGIKRFHELKPDLTLVEAMIPKKHGFEVCQELKKTPHGQASAVLIITSVYKGRKYRSQAMHSYRCDEYIEKPISDETLVSIVQRHLPERDEEPAPAPPAPEAAAPAGEDRDAEPPAGFNPLSDLSDAEVLDHLDALLPGDLTDTPKAAALPLEEASLDAGNLVPFDPERVRARSGVDPAAHPSERSRAPALRFSGGSQPALAPEHVERPLAPPAIEPPSPTGHAAKPPERPPIGAPASRERLYFWIALVLAAALVAVIATVVAL